jgi:hypothetical protein
LRGLLGNNFPHSNIKRSFSDIVELFNVAEVLADGICHDPFDVNGLLAVAGLPQGDNRVHAVGPVDSPGYCNLQAAAGWQC